MQRSKNIFILARIPFEVAHHQHALVRYVTLDRCLTRFRLSKEELIDRCSEAVNRVTGDSRRLSEKTFFNDIRAMREGIVLGREANVVCDDGRYSYAERGFTLFGAGKEEMIALLERLESFANRAQLAWERIERSGLDQAAKAELKDLLLGDDVYAWLDARDREEHAVSEKRRLEMLQRLKDDQAKRKEQRAGGEGVDGPMEQRAGSFYDKVLRGSEEVFEPDDHDAKVDPYRFLIRVVPGVHNPARTRRYGLLN